MVHDFTVLPLRMTVHAPQFDVSQPTCVPVSPADSRMKWTSRVRGSTAASLGRPLIVILTCCLLAMREDPFCGSFKTATCRPLTGQLPVAGRGTARVW